MALGKNVEDTLEPTKKATGNGKAPAGNGKATNGQANGIEDAVNSGMAEGHMTNVRKQGCAIYAFFRQAPDLRDSVPRPYFTRFTEHQ